MKGLFVTTAVLAVIIVPVGPVYAGRYDAGDAFIVSKLVRDGHTFYVPRYHYPGTASHAGITGYPFPSASQAFGLSRLPGQSNANPNAFAWRLVGDASDSMITLSAGGVSLGANRAAGCSIWSWLWNGRQLINHRDYGRELQGSLSWVDSSHNTPNPTEAGDGFKNGAPCSATVSGASLSTTSVPLEWNGGRLAGTQGGPDRPVIWEDMTLGKEVSLNYMNMGPVARYETELSIPRALVRGHVEIPTVYLAPELYQTVTYDARSRETLPATGARNRAATYEPKSGYGGIIATTSRHDFAMGIYGVVTSSGGSVSFFTATNYPGPTNGGWNGTSIATVKLAATYVGPIAAGRNTYTAWVISGTLDQVKRAMSALYRANASQASDQ
ncbi:MAG: hypothetical protein ACREUL_10835 [Steroidobacteraceae bacterium]